MFTVLLPADAETDYSARAVEYLTRIPNADRDVKVIVLNVFEEFEASGDTGKVRSEEFFDEDAIPDTVTALLESLEDRGIAASVLREHGDPVDEILAVAEERDVDAILMAGRKRTPIGKALFGSVTQRILLSADRPVTVLMEQ